MLTIELPWPPVGCHPNRSVTMHWSKKGAARKEYRQSCGWVAKTIHARFEDGNIPVSIVFYPPNGYGDIDNMLAAIKGGIDGVCEVWGINDKRLRPMTLDVAEKFPLGKVVITFGIEANGL